jgi:hypothetical protein
MSDQSNISLSALPLKAYDFFSIVFPGASVLLSAYFFEDLYHAAEAGRPASSLNCSLPIHWAVNEIWRDSGNASTQAAVVAVSMCMIYLAGQLVSSVANFFLDRIFVYKCYGYPYEHLVLEDRKKNIFVDYFSRRFYRGSIFWLHVAAFFFVMYDIYNSHICYLLVAFCCSGIFLIALITHLVGQRLYRKNWNIEGLYKRFINVYVLFYRWLMNPIQHINQTGKPMQKELAEKYKVFFKQEFGIDAEVAESDNYWLCLFYVRQKDPSMSSLVHRWHQTAVFARNMAASFYAAYVYSALILWYETGWNKNVIQAPGNFHITAALSCLYVVAVFLVIRFYYFYVSYYSKCLYRAFVFLHLGKEASLTGE